MKYSDESGIINKQREDEKRVYRIPWSRDDLIRISDKTTSVEITVLLVIPRNAEVAVEIERQRGCADTFVPQICVPRTTHYGSARRICIFRPKDIFQVTCDRRGRRGKRRIPRLRGGRSQEQGVVVDVEVGVSAIRVSQRDVAVVKTVQREDISHRETLTSTVAVLCDTVFPLTIRSAETAATLADTQSTIAIAITRAFLRPSVRCVVQQRLVEEGHTHRTATQRTVQTGETFLALATNRRILKAVSQIQWRHTQR